MEDAGLILGLASFAIPVIVGMIDLDFHKDKKDHE